MDSNPNAKLGRSGAAASLLASIGNGNVYGYNDHPEHVFISQFSTGASSHAGTGAGGAGPSRKRYARSKRTSVMSTSPSALQSLEAAQAG